MAKQSKRETHRRSFDAYETPPHYVDALIERIGLKLDRVYDCCSGTRAILAHLRHRGWNGKSLSNDLDRRCLALRHMDARQLSAFKFKQRPTWCITNPPFKYEEEILRQALNSVQNVAFLARLSFLEPTISRTNFWRTYGANVEIIVLSRYSFRNNSKGHRGSDSQTCCWLIWRDRPTLPNEYRQFFVDGRRAK